VGGVCGGVDGGTGGMCGGSCDISCVCDDVGGGARWPLCVQEHKPPDSSEISLHDVTSSGPAPAGNPRERQHSSPLLYGTQGAPMCVWVGIFNTSLTRHQNIFPKNLASWLQKYRDRFCNRAVSYSDIPVSSFVRR
jgi:hypothetical protein